MKITGLKDLSDEELFLLHEAAYYRGLFGVGGSKDCLLCEIQEEKTKGECVIGTSECPLIRIGFHRCYNEGRRGFEWVAAIEREMGER